MKTKPRSGMVWLIWIVAGFTFEVIALLDDVPNNTLSHHVVYAVTEHPWVGIALPAIVLVTLGHWLLRRWIWAPPTWEEDPKE